MPDRSPNDAQLLETLASSVAPKVGEIFEGRFAIERVLGRGGMGYVLLATHIELAQHVAIKLLAPERELNDHGSRRLLREARACARIKSQHVVRVLDVVHDREAPPYIVMEYLEGEDLAERLKRRGPLSVAQTVELVTQACQAIGEAHRLGIVHRDLKPSNLFVCERVGGDLFVKVLDFGISKVTNAGTESLTHSHALLGSPSYASPEQLLASHDVDSRADIWSLGVILYEALTGRRPFDGSSLAQICTRILQEPPRPLATERPDIPVALTVVVLRCLEKDPARRYQSVDELVSALLEFQPSAVQRCLDYLVGLPVAAPATSSTERAVTQPTATTDHTLTSSTAFASNALVERPVSLTRRASGRWLGGMAAVLVLLVAAWLYQVRRAPLPSSGRSSAGAVAALPVTAVGAGASSSPSEAAPDTSGSTAVSVVSGTALKKRAPNKVVQALRHRTGAESVGSAEVPWVDSR